MPVAFRFQLSSIQQNSALAAFDAAALPGAPMSDAYDVIDDARDQRKATLGQFATFIWNLWKSQPSNLAGFGVLFALSVACDLAFPFASARLVEALSTGPSDSATREASWAFGVVALTTFAFYLARNTSVRFWIPFAANNMRTADTAA